MTKLDVRSKLHVSFAPSGGTTTISNNNLYANRSKEELKQLWYSREELMDSFNEAKQIVKLIHLVGGKLEAIDHSRHCVVGLEKYHGKKEREKYRKMLIRSVLIRQEMNRGLGLGTAENGCLSEISQMMSSSFKEFALWQAAMHEFHAYGSSKPSQSLLESKAVVVVDKRDGPPSMAELPVAKKPRQCMLETNFSGADDNLSTNGLNTLSSARHIESETYTYADTCTISASSSSMNDKTNLTNTVQNSISLHHDMVKVMEGYRERKRLRCEVATLVDAHLYHQQSHSQPLLPYPQPSVTAATMATGSTSKR